MSEADQFEINYYGTVAAKAQYVNTTLTFMDVGIQLFMCLYGLSTFLETPKEVRKGRIPFIIISFSIWSMATFTAALDSWTTFQKLFLAGPTGREFVIQWRTYNERHNWFIIANTTSLLIYIVIGDSLMLYRCFILWRHKWWVMILPVLTFLASIGMGIATVYPWPRNLSRVPTSAWTFLSVSMNIMVTGLIVFRLVRARQAMIKAMPNRTPPKLYSTIIAIVIESAAPLTFFGLCFGVMLLSVYETETIYQYSAVYVAETMFGMLYYSFSALSPQMIIFRVTTGRSWLNSYDDEKATTIAFSQPLQFVHDGDSSTSQLDNGALVDSEKQAAAVHNQSV